MCQKIKLKNSDPTLFNDHIITNPTFRLEGIKLEIRRDHSPLSKYLLKIYKIIL